VHAEVDAAERDERRDGERRDAQPRHEQAERDGGRERRRRVPGRERAARGQPRERGHRVVAERRARAVEHRLEAVGDGRGERRGDADDDERPRNARAPHDVAPARHREEHAELDEPPRAQQEEPGRRAEAQARDRLADLGVEVAHGAQRRLTGACSR
jgi:hypothetical protein